MAVRTREWKGSWWVFVDAGGRRRAKRIGKGKAGKKLAEQVRKQWDALIALGQADQVFRPAEVVRPVTIAFPTLSDALEQWITRREKSQELRGSTPSTYRTVVKTWIRPQLGGLPVDRIAREQIGAVIQHIKASGRSRSTVEHARKVLRGLFRDLIETKQLAVDPTERLAYFVGRMPRRRGIGIFSKEECATLLRAAEDTRWHAFVATALGTGLRWGELAALTRDDLDFRRGRLHVRQSWSPKAGATQPPKTDKTRLVPLAPELLRTLRAWCDVRAAEGWGAEALVFPGDQGRHIRNFHDAWTGLLKRAGLAHRPFHCLRHSFASHALRAGVRPELVQRWLGHAQLSMTLDVYREHIPDHSADAADAAKLGELLQ